MNLKSIGGLSAFWLFLAFACLLPAGSLRANELTDGTSEPPQNTKSESPNLTDKWESLDKLLTELAAESIQSVEDSKTLSEQVDGLQTEVSVLRFSFGELLTLYGRSEDSRIAERQAAGRAIEQEVVRADRAENLNRILGTTSVIGWVLAVVGWVAFAFSR